jgi:hypothetical protein
MFTDFAASGLLFSGVKMLSGANLEVSRKLRPWHPRLGLQLHLVERQRRALRHAQQ